MRSFRGRRFLGLIVLIIISVVALGFMSAEMPEHNASASLLAPDGTQAIVLIGDGSISANDFKQNVGAVNTNLAKMQGEIDSGAKNSAQIQGAIDLIHAHGVENVALGGMIENQALYELAVSRGFAPKDDVINAQIAHDKTLAAQNTDPATAAYIKSVGADRFWSSVYPALLRQQLATQALLQNTIKGALSNAEAVSSWTQVQKEALSKIDVTVLDPQAIAPASTNAAIAYLLDYWQFSTK